MKFAQIVEFSTGRIDEFNTGLDDWMARTDGNRISHRAVLERDRDATDRYLLLVGSTLRARQGELSRPGLGSLLRSWRDQRLAPTFRSLDVLREEDL
jgi:hypothetical protein